MAKPTSEAWAQMRHDYEHTDRPVDEICDEHGISAGTLRDRMRRWHWTRRRPLVPREGPPRAPEPPIDAAPLVPAVPQIEITPSLPAAPQSGMAANAAAPHAAPGDDSIGPEAIGARLQATAARVLPAIEATVARLAAQPVSVREMERTARALAALTRTLHELNALQSRYPAPPANDRGPEDNDEFLLDLARRIDHFAALHGVSAAAKPQEP
jgi:hypothetical protein